MGIWKKDLSSYVWTWLEPVFGALFLYVGVKAILTGEDLRRGAGGRGALQSGAMHGRTQGGDFGQAGAGAHFDKSHGTAKPDNADANAAVHAVDERIFKED
jgi:hypothetical protein